MITKEDALQQFKNIVGTKASWANLLKSQFLNHFSIFMSWALRQAFWVVERVFQEIFLSTAVNESSVRAHAEDREYIPRKAVPASGTVNIANKGEYPVVIPAGTSFFSDTNEFLAEDPVSIAAVGNKDANVRQATRQTLEHAVSEEKRFYEILLDLDVTARLASYSVKIDEAGDGIFEDMSYSRLFANAAENDLVYDEFFKHTGQTGIRFGNGIFGKIPPVGAVVRVEMELTEGDTYLIAGETLDQAGTLLDTEGNPASLEIVTVTPVANGVEMEHGDELKANLHYWPLYNELLIWAEDYRFFCRKRYPKILWFKAWGEEEQEAEAGAPSLDYINKVFISAYEKNQHQGDWEADTEYKVWDTVSITGGDHSRLYPRAYLRGNGAERGKRKLERISDLGRQNHRGLVGIPGNPEAQPKVRMGGPDAYRLHPGDIRQDRPSPQSFDSQAGYPRSLGRTIRNRFGRPPGSGSGQGFVRSRQCHGVFRRKRSLFRNREHGVAGRAGTRRAGLHRHRRNHCRVGVFAMIDWLVKRLSPVKDKAARWVHLGEAIQEFWEEYFDPKLEELRGLRSIYTANEDGLKKLIAELGEFFEDTDRPIAVAWRKMELKFKDREFILTSSFSRKFKGLPVDWEPLYAPKGSSYGTEFVPEGLVDDISDYFLTSRGILTVNTADLTERGYSVKDFLDDAEVRVRRIKPLHIVFDGYKFLRTESMNLYWGSIFKKKKQIRIDAIAIRNTSASVDFAYGSVIKIKKSITINAFTE